jgi:hypothetical protein
MVNEAPMNNAENKVRQWLLLAAEVALVLAIVGILVAVWLPVWLGARPGAMRW